MRTLEEVRKHYKDTIKETEEQARQAAYDMRRALCRADISEINGGAKTKAIEIINKILGVNGVEYKVVKVGFGHWVKSMYEKNLK